MEESNQSSLLRPGVSRGNWLAFLACALASIAALVHINVMQSLVMIDLLNYPRARLGSAAGSLTLADELVSLLLVPGWGVLSDRIGRRLVMTAGLFLMALATSLYPWSTRVFPQTLSEFPTSLLAVRMLFALGGSAGTAMLTAILADCAAEGGRSRLAAMLGVATGLGALLAAAGLTRLPLLFTGAAAGGLRASFAATGCLLACLAVVALFGLPSNPPPPESEKENAGLLMASSETASLHSKCPWARRVSRGLAAGWTRPTVALAYLSGFCARAMTISLTLFIGMWVDNHLTRVGICPPPADLPGVRCPAAKRQASNLLGVAHTAVLLAAPLFGILGDRLASPCLALAPPALLASLAFGLLLLLPTPTGPAAYALMALAGIAEMGTIIASMALVSAVSPLATRGSIAGVYSFWGAMGIIVASQLGGWLFDRWGEQWAFVVVLIPSLLMLIASLALRSLQSPN